MTCLNAQESIQTKPLRFNPSFGITYNLHSMKEYTVKDDQFKRVPSHFPGIEIGFVLSPKTSTGWYWEYRNTFLGELAIYGFQKIAGGDGILDNITEYSMNNGFLGRLDFGKRLISQEKRSFEAGFVIADKVVLGTQYHPGNIDRTSWEESYSSEGFHFSPGFYAAYSHGNIHQGWLAIRFSLTQSLFNLHQFDDESAVDHFVLPLFSELDISYRLPSGWYLRAGGILAASYTALPADARVRMGAGYMFRTH